MAEKLLAIPRIAAFGTLLKSSDAIPLNETEAETVVAAVKHTFKSHIVIQYDCTNTLSKYVLQDVSMEIESSMKREFIIPAGTIGPKSTGSTFVAYKLKDGDPGHGRYVWGVLTFVCREIINPDTNELEDYVFEDSCKLEDLDIGIGDFMVPIVVEGFQDEWDRLAEYESSGSCLLDFTETLEDAIMMISKSLSMMPLEGTETPESTTTHTLKLAGKSVSGLKVLAEAKLVNAGRDVQVDAVVRGEDRTLVKQIGRAFKDMVSTFV